MNKSILLIAILFFACTKETPDTLQFIDRPLEPKNPIIFDSVGSLCEDGMAGIYPCLGYDLLSKISLVTFGSETANDNWGWVDPETAKEYVLFGLDNVILTPHIAASTSEAQIIVAEMVANQFVDYFLRDKVSNIVT